MIQIVVPVYNEGDNLRVLYQNLITERVPFDVLYVVYDFDEDTTVPVVKEIGGKDPRVRPSKNILGRGVINALKWGFSQVQEGPVIVLMGDNSDKLSIVSQMIELWKKGATIVSPSRYMPDGKQHGGGVIKSNLSRIAGLSLRLLGFPTSDPTNNFKLYDGDWLRAQTIESTGGFEVALELCFKAYSQNKLIEQLPTEWWDRTEGTSQFQLKKWLPKYLLWYTKILRAIILGSLFSAAKK